MKRIYALLLTVFLVPGGLLAQKLEVVESKEKIDGESHNALTIKIPGVPSGDVESEVRSEVRGMGRVRSRKNPLFIDDAEHRKMGDNPFDFYAAVEEVDDGWVKLIVAVNLGGAYLNSNEHGDRYDVMAEMIREFAVNVAKGAMEAEVEKEEDKLKELNDKMEELEETTEDKKELIEEKKEVIEKAKKAIKQAEKDIEDLKKKKEKQTKKVEKQQKEVEKAKK